MWGAALFGWSGSAIAQAPFDAAINVQLFEYAIGPKSFLTVTDADVAPKGHLGADVLITYLTKPFTILDVNETENQVTGTRTEVVESMTSAEISAAYGLTNALQIGVALPLIVRMTGEGLDPAMASPDPDGLQATGLGDLRMEAKLRLWRKDSLRLAAVGGIRLPTSVGGGGDFLGDDFPSGRGQLAVQWSSAQGRLSLGANAGVILRKPRTLYSSTMGQQLLYGGAGAFRITRRVTAIGELFGRTGVTSLKVEQSPLEIGAGVRIVATKSLHLLLGAGAGLIRGIGSPGLRMFGAVGWSPDHGDDDNDGVSNHEDSCPSSAEDRDGFEDGDGCPDRDNDGDMRRDEDDQCPLEKEDIDGFEDDDGCPELDNDADGFPDTQDRCPGEAEDGMAPNSKDGCPRGKSDSDGDGVVDVQDLCSTQAEDMDGFEDGDGCPDPDNDRDGIEDEQDGCSLCAEDQDGFEDQDGCPEPESDSVYMRGERLIIKRVVQFSRNRIVVGRDGTYLLDDVAAVMKKQTDVTGWLLVVAANPLRSAARTRRRSQSQANAIKKYLVTRGIPASAVEARGAVADRFTIGMVIQERGGGGAEVPEPVCPPRLRAKPGASP